MKIEIVTPAGRQRYLELLFLHLKSQRADFDQWTLWLNTIDKSDIDYCKKLEKENNWIKTIDLEVDWAGNYSIPFFFKEAKNSNTLYIRLDDDVIWMEKDFISKLSKFRLENPDYFLVYGNIINNAIIDHIHQRIGALPHSNNIINYNCGDASGWFNPLVAELKHENFFNKFNLGRLDDFKFKKWDLFLNERVSINCVSWLGKDFQNMDIANIHDEEQFLSSDYPKMRGLINTIYGEAICCHFSFYTQRERMDNSNMLERYNNLLNFKI